MFDSILSQRATKCPNLEIKFILNISNEECSAKSSSLNLRVILIIRSFYLRFVPMVSASGVAVGRGQLLRAPNLAPPVARSQNVRFLWFVSAIVISTTQVKSM